MIEFCGVTKDYGPARVLSSVDVSVASGEVLGLIGENGAGKSTLLNALCGLVPYAGAIRLDGQSLPSSGYAAANKAGIWRVFQDPALIPGLPIYEAMFLGLDRVVSRSGVYWRRPQQRRLAAEVLRRAELDLDERRLLAECNFGRRQLIEAAKIAYVPELIGLPRKVAAFDEPTAGISKPDIDRLFGIVRRLRSEGVSVIFVSHRLEEIHEISDRVVVLRDGHVVWTGERGTRATPSELQRKMVGRDRAADFYHQRRSASTNHQAPSSADTTSPAMQVRRLSYDPPPGSTGRALRDIDLRVGPGEILGICGLVDSGKSELARCLAGADRPNSGEIKCAGNPVKDLTRQWKRLRIVYVPPDRASEGVIPLKSIKQNISLASGERGPLGVTRRFGIWSERRASKIAHDCIRDYQINGDAAQPVAALSGGNQQKVLLAKWLRRQPRIVVLDNPTIGIDVGTKEEVYSLLRATAKRGTAVILVSDELAEVIGMSDRIAVVREGRIVITIDCHASTPTEHELIDHMLPRGRTADKVDTRYIEVGLAEISHPLIRRLAEEHGESVHLSVYGAGDAVYIDKADASDPVRSYTRVGGRAPAYCVATGKALLAHQPEKERQRVADGQLERFTDRTITNRRALLQELAAIRESGVALNHGEWRADVGGVAVPIIDPSGALVAAIGFSGPLPRIEHRRDALTGALLTARERLHTELEWQTHPAGPEPEGADPEDI
jgi:simple sugar transport system ATP-binding protein/ribose transport system ATP-binding protein